MNEGASVFASHAAIVTRTANDCRPNTHTPDQTRALLDAVLQCIDLVSGITPATRPRAASPAQPAFANRTRTTPDQPAPMNPVQRHYGTGETRRPAGDDDHSHWLHEYTIAPNHHDRCEVVRRAARYLNQLLHRDPNAPKGYWTDNDIQDQVLTEGHDWPLDTVARRFQLTERTVAIWRIEDGRHPLTGKPWTAPDHNTFAAQAAREMRAAGLNSTDIGRALGRNASTVREWTSSRRRAA